MQFSAEDEKRLAIDDELSCGAALLEMRGGILLSDEQCAGTSRECDKIQTEKSERSHAEREYHGTREPSAMEF